jgi:uncharacterized protein (TIGR02996 family)
MTDHYQDLLRCVLEEPHEDSPRLVLADWLEENGQFHRAEFIRLEIKLARRLGAANGEAALNDEEEQRYKEACMVVKGERLAERWFDYPISIAWRRGFAEAITIACNYFMLHAKELFSSFPILEVKLTDKDQNDNQYLRWHVEVIGLDKCGGCLPNALYKHVKEYITCDIKCTDSLSQGCVSYGRAVAGLPPLLGVKHGEQV